jgi:hypothetical protein
MKIDLFYQDKIEINDSIAKSINTMRIEMIFHLQ